MDYTTQSTGTNSSKKVRDEVKGLREDMQNIVSRLHNLKNQSKEAISEQLGDLVGRINDLSDQGIEKGKVYYEDLAETIKKQPIQSAVYAFCAGVILTALIKR